MSRKTLPPQFAVFKTRFEALKKNYSKGSNEIEDLGMLAVEALKLLRSAAKSTEYKLWPTPAEGERFYDVFSSQGEKSRPIRRDLFINDPDEFEAMWEAVCLEAEEGCERLLHDDLSRALYTCVLGVASVFDIFKRSKKPPGTFLEVLVGSLAARISGLKRKGQIRLPKEGHKVTTDIVIELQRGGPGVVFPCKITTRERIVQVFAHQRLLDSVFGEGTYRSALVCVSETQLDTKTSVVKEICVPIQIEIFQKYLAKLEGLYYLDPPVAYVEASFAKSNFRPQLPVKDLSALLSQDLALIVNELRTG
ncbi:MAG: hypothetical protein ACOYXY_16065 [Thermodesulfobacteriota bacterium]